MSRGRNMARPEGPEEVTRNAAEVQLDEFLQENVFPVIGNVRYYRLFDLIESFGKASYARGYMQGGRDERSF